MILYVYQNWFDCICVCSPEIAISVCAHLDVVNCNCYSVCVHLDVVKCGCVHVLLVLLFLFQCCPCSLCAIIFLNVHCVVCWFRLLVLCVRTVCVVCLQAMWCPCGGICIICSSTWVTWSASYLCYPVTRVARCSSWGPSRIFKNSQHGHGNLDQMVYAELCQIGYERLNDRRELCRQRGLPCGLSPQERDAGRAAYRHIHMYRPAPTD